MDFNRSELAYFDPISFLDMDFSQSEASCFEPIVNTFKENSPPPTNPFGLLKFYGTKVKRFSDDLPKLKRSDLSSAFVIMKLAKARIHEIISKNANAFSILANSLGDHHVSKSFVFEDIEIAILLQAAAQKVAVKEFNGARKLLRVCMLSACTNGTPVQRIVYYFAESLQVRIDHEIGITPNYECYTKPQDIIQTHYSLQPVVMEQPQEFQKIQEISQFVGIQSILDGVGMAKRIHVIDLGIKNGSLWTVFMQALSERMCPIEHLKITAIGTSDEIMIETSKRLSSFAETMKLPFSFGIVLSDLNDIKKDCFELGSNETVAIYSSLSLFSLVGSPVQLESLLAVMRTLKPRVMVVHELNASTNSPIFLERFDGAISHLSTLFDFYGVLRDDNPYRNLMEATYFRIMIRNILISEGKERIHRHEKIHFWRMLFIRCGFAEMEVSSSALYQAKLLRNTCDDVYRSCTIDLDGKSLSLGWKGNPLVFVSIWKLHRK